MSLTDFPVSGTIVTYIPDNGSISSLDVMDIGESHDGMVAFATTNGLSLFDSGWATIQAKPWEYNIGLQDNYIQTIDYDKYNSLWLGFSAGVQQYDGTTFSKVGTNEIFSTMSIHDILRDNNTIWITNGNSGLNHFSEDKWEWIRPFTDTGPGAYYITSMAKDHASGNIIMTSRLNGVWKGVSGEKGLRFTQIPISVDVTQVVDYPFGGVILFNENTILYYSESGGIVPIIRFEALGYGVTRINDVAVTENGMFVIGTNFGLYGYRNGEVIVHITRNIDGITSDEVTKVFADSKGRWWFITKGEAGYYLPDSIPEKIPVTIVDDYNTIYSDVSESSNPIQIPVHYTE